MKMALSEFVLREKGIYGILHVIILILSLFLVISISVDSKVKAWKKKVATDNPAWKQYIADGGTDSHFYRTYAIEFIPRFMLIGPDGKIIEIDYMKPSRPGCAENLKALVERAFNN